MVFACFPVGVYLKSIVKICLINRQRHVARYVVVEGWQGAGILMLVVIRNKTMHV